MELERLDVALVRRGLADTRERAKRLIGAGSGLVYNTVVTKSSLRIRKEDSVVLLNRIRQASRGGLKLERALQKFNLNVSVLTALDVGASTSGFTDCLLKHGALRVYAIDVEHDQLVPRLRADPRVQMIEGPDIRQLSRLPELVDLAVVDVSLISLRLVLPSIARFLKPETGEVIALVKPQYEAGVPGVVKRGVVRDPPLRREIVIHLLEWIQQHGWSILGLIHSSIQGGEGNIEYLAHLGIAEPTSTPFDKHLVDKLLS